MTTPAAEIERCPRCDDPKEFCGCASMSGSCGLCDAVCDGYDYCYGCQAFVCSPCDDRAQNADPKHDEHMPRNHTVLDHLPTLQGVGSEASGV
jgi:hypothetical protein